MTLSLSAESQSDKRDYVWLGGYDYLTAREGLENIIFDFNDNIHPDSINLPLSFFSGNNASICDRDGNLLYYTNGCHIAGADHQILPNGSGLNPGPFITDFLMDTCSDYRSIQEVLFLEDPGVDDNHYLLHKTIVPRENQESYMDLKYTYISGVLNSGLGDVIVKNQNVFNDSTKFLFSYITAINSKISNDWWIAAMGEFDTLYMLKLDDTGFNLENKVELETEFFRNTSGSGTMKFSPDGNHLAFYNPYDDLHIYDFDRETGELTNHRYLLIREFPDSIARFSALEWSPNSRFIYVTTVEDLWQVDTWEEHLDEGLEHIDTYDGGVDPFWTTFFLMALAPDCRIYMNSTTGAFSYHVINKPNEKGVACDFVQQGIKLPFPSGAGTLPNFPRYRVDEEDKCDPTITSIFGENIYWRRDLTCYPNPVRDQLTVELPEQKRGQLVVVDMNGQIFMTREVLSSSDHIQLSMGGLSAGTYSVEYIPDNNKERRIWTSRVVKVD